jgi:hypothetical protein
VLSSELGRELSQDELLAASMAYVELTPVNRSTGEKPCRATA